MAAQLVKETIIIEAEFGSDIQQQVSMKVLREFLEAWKTNVVNAHRRNRVIISAAEGKITRN